MFLEILTRTFGKRPTMLALNQASLAAQTSADWTQTLLMDEQSRGIGWASEHMAAYAPQLRGDYIWVLDDDDVCIRETFVAELQQIVAAHDPDLIIVRMDCAARGVLPPKTLWNQPPVCGQITNSSFVARQALWQACAHVMVPGKYSSDFELIAAMYAHTERVFWHDAVAAQVQWIGLGRPE